VFEDDGEVLFYGTGRNKVPGVDPAQLPRMRHHERRRNVAATPSIIRDTAIAVRKPIRNATIQSPFATLSR
jgi:hypothetical protein